MNTFKFGGFGGVHLHHISFLSQERQSSFFSFLLKFQCPSCSPPPICHHWTHSHGSVWGRNIVISIWSQWSRDGWWLRNSWFHFPLLEETVLAGCYVRNASHVHQFHQGEKRGILPQLPSTPEQNIVRHYLTLKSLTGFKTALKWFCNRYKSSLDFHSLISFEGK